MVEISVGGGGEFKGSEADVIESFVINAVGFVGVLYQLVDGQGSVVGLHHSVGHLGRGDYGVGVHDPVGVLLSDLGDEQCSHTRPGSASQRVCKLESLNTSVSIQLRENRSKVIRESTGNYGTILWKIYLRNMIS